MKTRKVLAVALGLIGCGIATAGPDLVKYPKDYLKGDLYGNVDRHDVKQYRELWASPGVVQAVRAGKPVPSGAVLTLVQWSVHQDDQGKPLLGPDGRFIKKDILAHTVMEKRTGWGTEYPPDLRNGEWEYQAFDAKGEVNPKANIKACFQCHKPHDKVDYVLTLSKLQGKFPGAETVKKAPKGDVQIVGFKFMPATITAQAGKPLKWMNADDSPHWIAISGSPQRTEMLLRGQTGSITFDKPGSFGYICGLHPSMKGTIEVK